MLSPLIEGSLGGLPTMQAAFNAYICDATPTGTSRAKIFTRFFGIFFVGVAAGPTLGNVIPIGAFQASMMLGVLNLLFVVMFLPESLTSEQREILSVSRVAAADEGKQVTYTGVFGRIRGYVITTLRETFGPMAILLPRKSTGQGQAVSGKDWGLTFLAMSLALYLLTIVSPLLSLDAMAANFGLGDLLCQVSLCRAHVRMGSGRGTPIDV